MPTAAQALERLAQPQNENLNWLLGDALRSCAQRPDWYQCIPLQQLGQGLERPERDWDGLIRRFRTAVADETAARVRMLQDLGPNGPAFNENLDNVVAEMVAVVWLSNRGLSAFRAIPVGPGTSPDWEATRNGEQVFIEVKNLRDPDSLSDVAFRKWNAERTLRPDEFDFRVSLNFEGIEPKLDSEQKKALESVIDGLRQRGPGQFEFQLPHGVTVHVDLGPGLGLMVSDDRNAGFVAQMTSLGTQSLIQKLMSRISKALSQLYGAVVPPNAPRILFLRWKVPDEIIGAHDEVRDAVERAVRCFLGQFFPSLEIHIVSNYDAL